MHEAHTLHTSIYVEDIYDICVDMWGEKKLLEIDFHIAVLMSKVFAFSCSIHSRWKTQNAGWDGTKWIDNIFSHCLEQYDISPYDDLRTSNLNVICVVESLIYIFNGKKTNESCNHQLRIVIAYIYQYPGIQEALPCSNEQNTYTEVESVFLCAIFGCLDEKKTKLTNEFQGWFEQRTSVVWFLDTYLRNV